MERVYEGVITIFYRDGEKGREFLLVENRKSGNITFVGGAKEGLDKNLLEAAERENKEELGIEPGEYELIETNVFHDFTFSSHKKERVGSRGRYQIFLCDLGGRESDFSPTQELKNVWWVSEKEVFEKLTFDDLKDVFREILKKI